MKLKLHGGWVNKMKYTINTMGENEFIGAMKDAYGRRAIRTWAKDEDGKPVILEVLIQVPSEKCVHCGK